jgi:tetratricopeptide (TPR) repeat protein
LRAALDCEPENVQTLRHLGTTLLRQGRFVEALPFWRDVAQKLPGDAQATQALADLRSDPPFDDAATVALHEQIRTTPTLVEPYLHLTEILIAAGELNEAENLLTTAQAACGGDLRIREERENLQLARSERQLAIARRRAELDCHPRATKLVSRLEQEHNRLEIDILNLRCERLPGDSNLRLELARRLKKAGNFSGAIQRLEEARRDPALAAAVLLELGECWQHLRQFAKALDFYEQAVAAAQSRDQWSRSGEGINPSPPAPLPQGERGEDLVGINTTFETALYRIGVLAAATNEPARARAALARLVAANPGFRDARERLDKLP